LANRNPYRGGPKGRVKWESADFGNFSREKTTIVSKAAIGTFPTFVARAMMAACGVGADLTDAGADFRK
jgi:hypothetical protein